MNSQENDFDKKLKLSENRQSEKFIDFMKTETERLIHGIDNFKFQMKNEDKIEDVKDVPT